MTDEDGVRDLAHYLQYVADEATARFERGMDVDDAADDIDLTVRRLVERKRIAVDVHTIYRGLDPSIPAFRSPSSSYAWQTGLRGTGDAACRSPSRRSR